MLSSMLSNLLNRGDKKNKQWIQAITDPQKSDLPHKNPMQAKFKKNNLTEKTHKEKEEKTRNLTNNTFRLTNKTK